MGVIASGIILGFLSSRARTFLLNVLYVIVGISANSKYLSSADKITFPEISGKRFHAGPGGISPRPLRHAQDAGGLQPFRSETVVGAAGRRGYRRRGAGQRDRA